MYNGHMGDDPDRDLKGQKRKKYMVNMGVEPMTLAYQYIY